MPATDARAATFRHLAFLLACVWLGTMLFIALRQVSGLLTERGCGSVVPHGEKLMHSFIFSKARIFVIVGAVAVAAAVLAQAGPRDGSRRALSEARYASDGALQFPESTEHWVTLGTSLGGDYAEGSFDPQRPGTIGVVQLEPNAYRALRETGQYPDGTMLLLTFYEAQSKSEPQVRGFVQGDVQSREIHVIDRKRYPEEGRAFFLFPGAASEVGARQPLGSRCVACHSEHGLFDATFAQFYPLIRPLAQTAKPRS